MRRAALHNLGCKVNAYETEAMQQLLEKAGYEIVPFEDEADVYVVNTCSVTGVADKKSRQMLHRARKRNPAAAVVAVGCYAQIAGERLLEGGSADILLGNNRKGELIEALDRFFQKRESEARITDIASERCCETLGIDRAAEHTRACIKIQDGCNQFCSYCIIPYARGRVRSRAPEDVVREAETLAGNGCKEIVLTGIHLSSYGCERPERKGDELIGLIERLDRVDGILRIRLGSLEPRIVTEEFAGRLAGLKTVCPHFHLSLQSGCDRTLKRMNRRYTAAEYEECCRILRRHFDNPAITTDVIVGFPGETEEEFSETLDLVRRVRFYELHVFPYSRRENTRAASMPEQVPEAVKRRRSAALIELGREGAEAYRDSLKGKDRDIIPEESVRIGEETYLTGYTREYVRAAVTEAEGRKGQLIRGRIREEIADGILRLVPQETADGAQ